MQIISKTNSLVLTGGHAATTALAVVEYLRLHRPLGLKIYWLGPSYAVEGKRDLTLEAKVLPKKGVIFKPLFSGRLQRRFTFWTIPSLLKIPFGFIHALVLLLQVKPCLILSFGGFASFPVVVVGWLLGIPVVIHEQTASVGRANRYGAFFASRIALAREESQKYFKGKSCEVVGNPILSEYFVSKTVKKTGSRPTIFVTCGSRGSIRINTIIGKCLPFLLEKYRLVHQVGVFDYEKYRLVKNELPNKLAERYEVLGTIEPEEMCEYYQQSDIVIARAGANTVSEIMALKKPSLLIPIPWSYQDEQLVNAQYAQKWGVADILFESQLNQEFMLQAIGSLFSRLTEIQKRLLEKQSPDKLAAGRLVSLIEEELECKLRP